MRPQVELPAPESPVAPGATALDQRYQVLCATLRIPELASADRYARLIDELKQRGTPRDTTLYLLFQLFLARVPTQMEIFSVARNHDYETSAQLARFFLDSVEFETGPQSRLEFEVAPRNTLLVDVTHTLTYAHNSGIQRVVRCMSKQMEEAGLDRALVRFDAGVNNFRLLNAAESNQLYDWRKPETAPGNPGTPGAGAGAAKPSVPFKTRIKKMAGRRLTEAVRSFMKTWREIGRDLRKTNTNSDVAPRAPRVVAPHEISKVLLIWDNKLLTAEVVTDLHVLERMCSLFTHTPVTSSIVMHDLIPLHHPEFCLVSGGFVHYLRLLRSVDRISCNSKSTASDVRKLMPLVPRSKAPPQIDTHYLGGDFDLGGERKADAAAGELPLVLSVGSIEVRKNHRRMLRAMVLAQKNGCRFRGVFAGNPGWLNEDFLQELAFFQAAGYQVEMRKSVSEAELRELYNQAAFTLYCSLVEGFGLPIVESVSKGVPCIASNRGSMQEIMDVLGGCVPVDPASEAEIAAAVESLLKDKARREKLQAEANQARWHTWREYAQAVHEFASEEKPVARRNLSAAA